jgi:acyl carrier protein
VAVGSALNASARYIRSHQTEVAPTESPFKPLNPSTEDPMDNTEAFDKFKQCAVEVLQVTPDKVTPEASFAEDLDADSLDLVELVMALEEEFKITVDESELEGVETVGQAFELVSSKL